VIYHNGQPVSQAVYCDYIVWNHWEERIREFVESDVQVNDVTIEPLEVARLWSAPDPSHLGDWVAKRKSLVHPRPSPSGRRARMRESRRESGWNDAPSPPPVTCNSVSLPVAH
jgi:hypothetical protein